MKTLYLRFMDKVVKTSSCWEWIGCSSGGYGRIWVKNEKWEKQWAHRVSWEMFRGLIPLEMFVCHSCDNPSCVNPDHLWIGTQSQNSIDMIEKGRAKFNMNIFKEGLQSRFKKADNWRIRERTLKSGR